MKRTFYLLQVKDLRSQPLYVATNGKVGLTYDPLLAARYPLTTIQEILAKELTYGGRELQMVTMTITLERQNES